MTKEEIESLLAKIDPGLKEMAPGRIVHGIQAEWATNDDYRRFGWNACRAEILNRLEAALQPVS